MNAREHRDGADRAVGSARGVLDVVNEILAGWAVALPIIVIGFALSLMLASWVPLQFFSILIALQQLMSLLGAEEREFTARRRGAHAVAWVVLAGWGAMVGVATAERLAWVNRPALAQRLFAVPTEPEFALTDLRLMQLGCSTRELGPMRVSRRDGVSYVRCGELLPASRRVAVPTERFETLLQELEALPEDAPLIVPFSPEGAPDTVGSLEAGGRGPARGG